MCFTRARPDAARRREEERQAALAAARRDEDGREAERAREHEAAGLPPRWEYSPGGGRWSELPAGIVGHMEERRRAGGGSFAVGLSAGRGGGGERYLIDVAERTMSNATLGHSMRLRRWPPLAPGTLRTLAEQAADDALSARDAEAKAAVDTEAEQRARLRAQTRCGFGGGAATAGGGVVPRCRKKLFPASPHCACMVRFCDKHRQAEAHGCPFDYRGAGRSAIRKGLAGGGGQFNKWGNDSDRL